LKLERFRGSHRSNLDYFSIRADNLGIRPFDGFVLGRNWLKLDLLSIRADYRIVINAQALLG
jgi:hypothetical protein